MKEINQEGEFNIVGRGKVFVIDLANNNISSLRKEFTKELMGKEVLINDIKYLVRGIEAFATGEYFVHNKVGLLVKEIK